MGEGEGSSEWPALDYPAGADTCATLQLWTQVVGKIRMALTPPVNHWWHVPLYVTARGLTTSAMPYDRRTLQIDFDFLDHRLIITASDGAIDELLLRPTPVASFYAEVMGRLNRLGLPVRIWTTPVEIADPIPFEQDQTHAAYDPDYANRLWRVLASAHHVFGEFRGGFLGKASPVHFFWGSFDLAVTRFSGRPAPPHSGAPGVADAVTREAYSHEVSSCGFWPGNGGYGRAAFYSYAYPVPPGFASARVTTPGAFYDTRLGEFVLPYEAVRQAADPRALLLDFLQQTYAAAADLAAWDRAALERPGT